jgi:type I restriction enzyme S subunit
MAKKKAEKSLDELLEEALVKEGEEPYEVPWNWEWVKLGKLTNVVGGGTPKTTVKEYFENGNIEWITPADLSNYNGMYIGKGKRNITKLGLKKSSAKLLKKGSLLLSSRAPIGYVAIASNELCTNQGFKSFEASDALISEYGYWNLKFSKDLIESMGSGTTFREISGKKVALIPFPLPPLPEQKRIVKKLSSMLGRLKEAGELTQEAKDTFEERRAAILNKAFTGELTKKWRNENPDAELELSKIQEIEKKPFDIPAGWEWVYLEEVSELITKGSSPKWQGIKYTDDKSQVLFITSENVRDGYLELDKEKYLELEFNCKQKRSILKNGDVLLNIVGASIGRAAIFDVERVANINQAVSIIRLVDKRLNRYLNFYLNSAPAKRYYSESKVDVARANLSLKDVSNIPLPLPPFEEQREIVRILDKLLNHEDEARALIDMEEQIELIEKSILSKAFRGELGTNDPNDEPAIELLKKSLEGKAKTKSTKEKST